MPPETKRATLTWQHDLVFTGALPGGPSVVIDANSREAPGPMAQLMLAAAACSATDVVLILAKMRVTLRALGVECVGIRRETEPRRYVSLALRWTLAGEGLDEAKARRAIALSVEKYCSVMASLAPDLEVTNDVVVA